jgi:hypothetical protein
MDRTETEDKGVYSNRFVILNEVKSSQLAGITSMATNVTSPAYAWILCDAKNDTIR